MLATKTPVTEIPARAMLDLEDIGDGGFRDAYAVFAMAQPVDDDSLCLFVEYDGFLVSLIVPTSATVPVITYAAPGATSNMLETS